MDQQAGSAPDEQPEESRLFGQPLDPQPLDSWTLAQLRRPARPVASTPAQKQARAAQVADRKQQLMQQIGRAHV